MEEKKEQKIIINKKLITQIIAIILFVVILVLSLITLSSSVKASNLAFGTYRFYIMESEAQPNIALKGDLVIAKKLKYGEVQKGDSIVYSDGKFYYCDEVVQTKKNNTIVKMVIAENEGVRYQFAEDEVSGKVIHNIHGLGNIISFLRTPIGMVFFVIFTICVFLLLRILFIKKDEKDDEQNKEQQNKQNANRNIEK